MTKVKHLACLAALSLTALLPAAAQVPAFPQRPVKIVIGFGPGTAIDTVGRMFAEVFHALEAAACRHPGNPSK